MSNPFDLSDALIRDLPHVRVTRIAPRNGQLCEYLKEYKAEGLDSADYWSQRENEFLLEFSLRKLKSVVEFAKIQQSGGGKIASVATLDAGITVGDWLGIKPAYTSGESLRHPFQHTGLFLELLRACLVALHEIHRLGIVHCDIKEDNICIPYTPYPLVASQPVRLDFAGLRLIDFAFSISPERPLAKPLPVQAITTGESYQSNLFKTALQKDHRSGKPTHLQQLDYRVDLYSLGYMAGRIYDTGLLLPPGQAGRAAMEGVERLVAQLKGFDTKRADKTLPHERLIATLDGLLSRVAVQAYREFRIETSAQAAAYVSTPVTPLLRRIEPALGFDPAAPTPLPLRSDTPMRPRQLPRRGRSWGMALGVVSGIALLGGLVYSTDWLPASYRCQFWGEDCPPAPQAALVAPKASKPPALKPKPRPSVRVQPPAAVPVNPPVTPDSLPPASDGTASQPSPTADAAPLPALSGANQAISENGQLAIALPAATYPLNAFLYAQVALAKPMYLRIYNRLASGRLEGFYLGKINDVPVSAGVFKYPPKEALYQFETETLGSAQLIAIASEQPIPKEMEVLDVEGRLTEEALSLSPTLVKLDYRVVAE